MSTFASTVDVIELVAESCGLRNPAVALQMRGVSRAWRSAVCNVVRRLARDEAQSWNGATRLCAWAAKLPNVARLCVVAGGAEWLQELPQSVLTPLQGENTVLHARSILSAAARLPHLMALEVHSLAADEARTLFVALRGTCPVVQRVTMRAVSFAFDGSAAIVAAAVPRSIVAVDIDGHVGDGQSGDRFCEEILKAHGARLQELRLGNLNTVGKGNGIGQKTIDLIGRLCPNVRHLDLTFADHVSVHSIVERLSELRYFSVAKRGQGIMAHDVDSRRIIDDDVLRKLSEHCPRLRGLAVGSMHHSVSLRGLSHIARGCPDFRELDLRYSSITVPELLEFASLCPELRHLAIAASTQPGEALTALGQAAPALEVLHLVGVPIAPATFADLPCLRTLVLDDGGTKFTHAMAATVGARCPELRKLVAGRNSALHDGSVELVARGCPELRHLSIPLGLPTIVEMIAVTHVGITAIASHCRHLEYLDISGHIAVPDDAIRAVARRCPKLHSLLFRRGGKASDDLAAELSGYATSA